MRKAGKAKDQEAADLIFWGLNLNKQESNREMINGTSFDPKSIDMLFDLVKAHACQTLGIAFPNVGSRIPKLDGAASTELGKGVRHPEGLCAWLLGKNEILVAENQRLSDYELMAAIRRSQIVSIYQVKDGISRKTHHWETQRGYRERRTRSEIPRRAPIVHA